MAQGEIGERGERGPRGHQGPTRRLGPLFGYFVSGIIFTVLIYFLLFQVRDDNLGQCQRNNEFRMQFNDRAATLDDVTTILIAARDGSDAIKRDDPNANAEEIRALNRNRAKIDTVPVIDCKGKFPNPWPFG